MRNNIQITTAVLVVALGLYAWPSVAQVVNQGEYFELRDSLCYNNSYEFTASNFIELKRGFSSKPKNNNYVTMEIDPYGIFPPVTGITGGPNPNDQGLVGAISGTIDVGAMGAAIYTIPLELPDGINGMKPNLSITYNSQAGNGLLGWGWDLAGLSSIERTGMTRYHDGTVGTVTFNNETDRFMLDGIRLIDVANYADSIEYKTEQDDMSKIMAYYTTELVGGGLFGHGTIKIMDHFVVWKPNGLIYEYGTSSNSQIKLNEPTDYYCWLLNRISDRNGNYIDYHYNKTTTGYSLSYIDYTSNHSTAPEFRVEFSYQSRLDIGIVAVGQNLLKNTFLLNTITVFKRDQENQFEELMEYNFNYHEVDRQNGYFNTRLDKILYSQGRDYLNPTIIVWPPTDNAYQGLFSNNINTIGQEDAFTNSIKFPGDFNGDGFTDVIVTSKDNSGVYSCAKVFLNQGGTNSIDFEYLSTILLNENASWIYVADFNGDGKDDFMIASRWNGFWPWRDLVALEVYLSCETNGNLSFTSFGQLGPYRINRNAIESVLVGDFLGKGYNGIIIQTLQEDNNKGERYEFEKSYYIECSPNGTQLLEYEFYDYMPSLRLMTADFDGDGATEIMYFTANGYIINRLEKTGNNLSYRLVASGDVVDESCDCYLGDFNGDGKVDMLSCRCDDNNNPVWQINLSGANGLVEPAYIIETFGLGYLGPNHHFTLQHASNESWFIQVGDFNGDGYDDIRHQDHLVYYDQQFYFGPLAESGPYQPFSGKKKWHIYSRPHEQMETCLGHFKGLETCDDLGDNDLFYLPLLNNRYDLKEICDGMGNKLEFGFRYLLQPCQNVNYKIRIPSTPIKTLVSITKYNSKGKPMTDSLSYSNPYFHLDGHGWLGFGIRERNTFEDGTLTERTINTLSLSTMTEHAMLLPQSDSSFVFPQGTPVLSSVSTYQFQKICCDLNPNYLITCPEMTEKTVVNYNTDNPGVILSKLFQENYYNNDFRTYSYTYHCDSTVTAVGDANAASLLDCEFRSTETTVFYKDNYNSWIINKPLAQKSIQSRTGKPDVETSRWYEYVSANSYLPSHIYELPDRNFSHSPLMVKTDFEYYSNGNLWKKNISVPYGQLGEQQKSSEYEYGSEGRQRLITNETIKSGNLSYETSYVYDKYDHIDTLMGANKLATVYQKDALNVTSWTINADGTKSCSAKRWAREEPLKPNNAYYYVWNRSSDGNKTLTFYHKTGAELRHVQFGFNGEPIFIDKQYDDRGRLKAVSESYKEGETVRWTTYGYDNLNRLTSVTTPDSTCTTIVYDGLRTETRVTPSSGFPQTSSVITNTMGWTTHSDDATGSFVDFDYYADGLLASATTNDDPVTTVTLSYDKARHRNLLDDPDYGSLETTYDAYGRLKYSSSSRESSAQTGTEYVYDGFDRVVLMTDGLDSTFTRYDYNETGVLKGKLEEIELENFEGADLQLITYNYDTLARPVCVTEQQGDSIYTTMMEYDNQSRVKRLVYPSGFIVQYDYRNGYLKQINDDAGKLLWKTCGLNADGQLLAAELGNGAVMRYTYDPVMHRLDSIVTTKNLQNMSFRYDNFGNLAARKDNMKNLEETFTYDNQNRLTEVWLGTTKTGEFVYDGYGRITAKTADGQVLFFQAEYNTIDKPHEMVTASTPMGVFPSTKQTITYTGFDKVSKIKQGADSLCFTYGYDHQRILMEEHVGNRHRTKRYVGNCEYVTESEGGSDSEHWLTYLSGPMGVYAVVLTKSGSSQVFYILKDNLGSWTTITDEHGNVEQRLSYDPWGNLRDPDTWANYTPNDVFNKPMFDRGYTGHEHLSAFGLINMNGRMYDPLMSAFLSPDRYVQDPMSAQGFNRYAYCLYNPLRYIDPSGWLAGSGGPSYPINTVSIEGQMYIVLPEFTVTSTPIIDEEFVYTPYYGGGGSDQNAFGNNVPFVKPSKGGAGGGGNHGGSPKNTTPDPNINIEIASKLLISANVYTSIESSLYFNRLTRTWRDKMDIFRSFDFNGNGSTGGKISYGEMMSVKYQKASSWLNGIGIGLSTIQMASAESIDDKIQYGSDLVFGMIGYAPGGGIISTFWFLGGRELVFQYGETMGLLLEDGINPGYPVYQPFK